MKKIIFIIAVMAAVGGAAFYAGMKYQTSRQNAARQNMARQFGANADANMVGAAGIRFRNQGNGGFASGEIIAKDDKSVTVKLRDGGSKIVFFSESTEIGKSAVGSADDLKTGEQIMVSGDQNSDGSVVAKTIQISPLRQNQQ